MKKKGLALVLALTLLVVGVVAGTLAWLTAKSDVVTNTFTTSDIKVELKETTGTEDKMIPGYTISKDPKVTVKAGSEACWLFVKVTESDNLDSFISYSVDSNWTALTGVSGVYYREVPDQTTATTDVEYSVLTNDQVTVKDTVTKDMMDAITAGEATAPTLTFKAYAIQKEGFTTAAAAWNEVIK